MTVRAERNKPLDTDFEVPVVDFTTAESTGSLNIPKPDVDVNIADLKLPNNINKTFDASLKDVSSQVLKLSPDTITKSFIDSVKNIPAVNSVGNAIGRSGLRGDIDHFIGETTSRLQSVNGEMYKAVNRICNMDDEIYNLLRDLLGPDALNASNLLSEIALFMSLINRLNCVSDFKNPFTRLADSMTTDARRFVATGTLLSGRSLGNPHSVIDVAGYGNTRDTLSATTDPTGIALGTLDRFDATTVRDRTGFIRDFTSSMNAIDPDWVVNAPNGYLPPVLGDAASSNDPSAVATLVASGPGSIDVDNLIAPPIEDSVRLLAIKMDTRPRTTSAIF